MSTGTLEKEDGTLDIDAANAALDAVAERLSGEREPAAKEETTRHEEEKPRGDEPAETEDKRVLSDENWVSAADIRELVDSLGLSKEDLAQFTGRDEFDRHVRLLDKQFMRDGKEAVQSIRPGDEQKTALNQIEAERAKEAQRERAAEQPRKDGKFTKETETDEELKLDPDYFDESLVKIFDKATERLKKLEARIQEMAQREQLTKHQQMVSSFDQIVDGLGFDEVFGSAEGLDSESDQYKSRGKLWDAVRTLVSGMVARGKPAPQISKSLIVRALNQEFSDKVQQKERQKFSAKVRQQAGRRYGGGSQKTPSPQKWDGDASKDPELLSAYRAMEAENG